MPFLAGAGGMLGGSLRLGRWWECCLSRAQEPLCGRLGVVTGVGILEPRCRRAPTRPCCI